RTAAAPGTAHPATARVSFREEVEPFLKANCGSCHSAGAHSSGFVVETPETLFRGGSRYGAKDIVPGRAAESALVAYLRGQKQPQMPLGRLRVPEAQIRKIALWIDQGAQVDAVRLGWPYTRPVACAVPRVRNRAWVRSPIDAFVLAKLEAKGLKPAP